MMNLSSVVVFSFCGVFSRVRTYFLLTSHESTSSNHDKPHSVGEVYPKWLLNGTAWFEIAASIDVHYPSYLKNVTEFLPLCLNHAFLSINTINSK